MLVQTKYFGEIEVDEDGVIKFPEGILGLEDFKRYALFEMPDNKKIRCLQSLDEPQIVFMLINPWDFFSDYDIDISDEELKIIDILSIDQVAVFNIMTLQDEITQTTANLLAPIIINADNRKAMQIVLYEGKYKTKHLVFSGKEGD